VTKLCPEMMDKALMLHPYWRNEKIICSCKQRKTSEIWRFHRADVENSSLLDVTLCSGWIKLSRRLKEK